ncbi:MAG: ABC transporter permease subunit [Acidimicrobiia bacterium]|nr:ABC transporter permease subunit [Acidimicrobiia bacterium]
MAPRELDDKPPFWRDVKVLAWVFQLVILALVLAFLAYLANNVRVNSADLGIPVGFEFLDQPSSFTIPGNDLRESQPVRDALVEGALNTLRVSIVGIVLATVLGILIGIGRLSGNWLLSQITRVYVEVVRNVPLLGLVIFAYLALVLAAMPRIEDAWQLDSLVTVSNRGLVVPWLTGPGLAFLGVVVLAFVVGVLVAGWRQRVAARTGQPPRDLLWAVASFVVLVLVGAALVGNGLSFPSLEGDQIEGGIIMQPEYFALLLALVIYTASHIAEIVRGSIQAVPRGQFEASSALAFSGAQRMRYIILPQALRIAVPPIGNQYLNLMKNSSLGFAISFFELTKVASTSIGNRSPAVPTYLLLMAIYLVFSLIISALVNTVNRRMQVE